MNTDKIYAESIAKEYAPKDHSKVIALRKLDAKAKMPATVFTYTWGIVSALVFGTGMCLGMQVIGDNMVLGIIIGIIGMIGCGVNYPIYKKLLEKGKLKLGLLNVSNEADIDLTTVGHDRTVIGRFGQRSDDKI